MLFHGLDGVNQGVHLEEGEMMMDALGGFLIFVNRAGKIVYIHQQVANILGVQQVSNSHPPARWPTY